MGRMKSTAAWTAVMMAGLAGGWQLAQGQAPAPSPTPGAVAPADTATLRAQYEQWRKDFKTWGRWAKDSVGAAPTTPVRKPKRR